jgi:hypothetical protein
MDDAKLVQREGLVPARLLLPGQVERLARVRYRKPRQPWTMVGVSPRPASVARRSASSPWRRPSAKAPSALKVRASRARRGRVPPGHQSRDE